MNGFIFIKLIIMFLIPTIFFYIFYNFINKYYDNKYGIIVVKYDKNNNDWNYLLKTANDEKKVSHEYKINHNKNCLHFKKSINVFLILLSIFIFFLLILI